MLSSSIFHVYVILFCFLNGVVGGSTALLLGLQPKRDRKSRAYLYLELMLLLNSGATAMLNLFLLQRWNVQPLYDVIAVDSLGLALIYFSFCLEVTNSWSYKHKLMQRLLLLDFLLGMGLVLVGRFSTPVGIDAYGYLDAALRPETILLIGVPIWLSTTYASWLLLWNLYRGRLTISPKIVWGIIFIALAMLFSIQTPLFRFLGGPLITVGLLLLVRPILQENVFDPIAHLNRQLTQRAEQLQAITRVGQVANSLLRMDVLKSTIEAEVKRGLAYDDARLFLVGDRTDTTQVPEVVRTAALTSQVVRSHAMKAELALPFTIADITPSQRELLGIFYLRRQMPAVFDDETVEVIQILANQIAVAFHNARLYEESRAANASKTRFISYISHEVRNPIANIYTTAQQIVEHEYMFKDPLPVEYRIELMRISRQADHLRHLIDDLLDLGQIETGVLKLYREVLNPLDILQEVQQVISNQLQPRVALVSCYSKQLPYIDADRTRIRQILINVLSNAAKFTDQGTISLAVINEEAMLRFEIVDTGPGISDAVMSRLFQAYTQDVRDAGHARRGIGLGLMITKHLVELHGGMIHVRSQVGKGTTVIFTIPLAKTGGLSAETGE